MNNQNNRNNCGKNRNRRKSRQPKRTTFMIEELIPHQTITALKKVAR